MVCLHIWPSKASRWSRRYLCWINHLFIFFWSRLSTFFLLQAKRDLTFLDFFTCAPVTFFVFHLCTYDLIFVLFHLCTCDYFCVFHLCTCDIFCFCTCAPVTFFASMCNSSASPFSSFSIVLVWSVSKRLQSFPHASSRIN